MVKYLNHIIFWRQGRRGCQGLFSLTFLCLFFVHTEGIAQSAMANLLSRNALSLNGPWNIIIDPVGSGDWKQVWQEKKPVKKTDFVEYSFEGGPVLQVPGDFNSQLPELAYYEGIVWYQKGFSYTVSKDKRVFLHFGAVNYIAEVFLNGVKLGSHEGGFTPFQFELTGKVKTGLNSIVVKVNNFRQRNGLPGLGYDWLNYGGITRDVNLIETDQTYIDDYSFQLKKGGSNLVSCWLQLNGTRSEQQVEILIPELQIRKKVKTNANGFAAAEIQAALTLWSPEHPKLYKIILKSETDSVTDHIGFRQIEVRGGKIFLNNKPVFLKGVNIHEENPYLAARGHSPDEAQILLKAARDLGCNLVRLAHYPHNENMVREAEKMGLMVWSELPVYQHIDFTDSAVPAKMNRMLEEMIRRDRNRCGVVVWSLSNETYPSAPGRNQALVSLTKNCRQLDATRLIMHVINSQGYSNNVFHVWDTLYRYSDLISINEYNGWYYPWQGRPAETKWNLYDTTKPVFISEFGGEALYGNNEGPSDEAAYWTEGYQEQIYKDQVALFGTIPNLAGVCPWLLFDYRSPVRMNQVYQKGYNRKGLLSEKGEKKKAWYVMHEYFSTR